MLLAANADPGHAGRDDAPHLTKFHEGWREAKCFDCHETSTLMEDHEGREPPDCGSCHGYNGAPHDDHAIAVNPCEMCHSYVEHLTAFQVPDDCIQCHMHSESPKGK